MSSWRRPDDSDRICRTGGRGTRHGTGGALSGRPSWSQSRSSAHGGSSDPAMIIAITGATGTRQRHRVHQRRRVGRDTSVRPYGGHEMKPNRRTMYSDVRPGQLLGGEGSDWKRWNTSLESAVDRLTFFSSSLQHSNRLSLQRWSAVVTGLHSCTSKHCALRSETKRRQRPNGNRVT